MKAILLDIEDSWPLDLRRLLEHERQTLASYELERERIDLLCRTDVTLRINPPENPYRRHRDDLLVKIDTILESASLVGWHCARLHPDEIASIERKGLIPLSRELLLDRITARVEAGDLTTSIAAQLRAANQVNDEHRGGKIWFVFSSGILANEHDTFRLFRSWGGEALYNSHERDPVIGSILRRIGVPCIVEAAVAARDLETFCSVGERFLNAYLNRRDIAIEAGPHMEGYVTKAIAGHQIRRVIRRGDPIFERMTDSTAWVNPV